MREIYLIAKIDWEDYDDVSDELILEDSGILDELKTGVTVEPLSSDAVLCERCHDYQQTINQIEDYLEYRCGGLAKRTATWCYMLCRIDRENKF